MKRMRPYLLLAMLLFSLNVTNAQIKVVGECSISFLIQKNNKNDTIGFKTVFIKGDQCKTLLQTAQLNQALYFNSQQTKAVITKDIGASHFLQEISYPPQNTPNLISMKETMPDSLINIIGYPCKNVTLKWSNGTSYIIWYSTEIAATVNTYELAFKEVPGLVLAYTIIPSTGDAIHYTAIKVDLSPVSLKEFKINEALYQTIE